MMMPFLYRNNKKKKNKKEIEKQQQQHDIKDNKYWKWPSSCKQYPKTQSFRGGAAGGVIDDDVIFKTVNSIFLSHHDHQITHHNQDQDQTTASMVKPPINWFTNTTNSSSCDTNNTTLVSSDEHQLELEECDDDLQEMVLARGVKSDRLFFDPSVSASASGGKLLLVLQEKDEEEKDDNNNFPILMDNSVNMVVIESEDPYGDFRASMEEMMNTNEHDNNNWEFLEELLYLYLRLNGKKNHGYIIKAMVDLVNGSNTMSTNISSTSSRLSDHSVVSSSSSAYSSALSSFHEHR